MSKNKILTKNKLPWGIAVFLIVIATLPIAYAQTTIGGSLFFVLINSAIVGVILFLLQSFLIPGKEPKEKTAVWVVIIVGSLVIGFLFGSQGFIWQHPVLKRFVNIYVLVNALIIGILAYFVLGFLDVKQKIKSPEGNAGYAILIFLGSLIWALGIQNTYGNIFIWQAYSYFISYFIGPEGILNPYPPQYRLLVFTGSFALLAFFFNNFLITGTGANQKVNYGLALILAMNMASSGVRVQSVIILGEIIFTIVLARALEATVKKAWLSWVVSIGLVGWASAAMTYGTQYQGFLATLLGPLVSTFIGGAPAVAQPTQLGWWIKTGLLILVVMAIFGGGLLVIGRERARGILQRFRERTLTRFWNEFKNRFQRHASQVGVVTRWDIAEGREPKSFVENRLLLFALLDYSLRLDIFNSKWYLFDKIKKAKMQSLWTSLSRYYDRKRLRYEISNYRSGTNIATFASHGWAHFDKQLLEGMREILELGYEAIRLVNNPPSDLNRALTDISNRIKDKNNSLIKIAESCNTSFTNFNGRIEPYGIWHHIRSIMLNLYDMYNVYGVYEHDYIFPKVDINRPPRYVPKFRQDVYNAPIDPAQITALSDAPTDVEVNLFGYDVSMINDKATNANAPSPRKLLDPKRQSDFYQNLIDIMLWLGNEWRGFVRDFRYGDYSPNSRTVKDYSDAISSGLDVHMDDDSVEFKRQGGIAFDRRVLANPGLWRYWGRKHYYGDVTDIVMHNPYPRITVIGIQSYLVELIKTRERDPERVINDFLNSYPIDLEKEINTKEELIQAIGRWREKKTS